MQEEGLRRPAGIVVDDFAVGAVFKGRRRVRGVLSPPGGVVDAAGRLGVESVPAAAVEHDDPIGVGPADLRQKRGGVENQFVFADFVEQPPDHHAGVIAVALDHPEDVVEVPLWAFGALVKAPGGKALLVDQKADPVAQIELEPAGHCGDVADHIKSHRLAGEDIAPEKVVIDRDAEGDLRLARGVGALEVNTLPVEPERAALEAEIAKTAHGRSIVGRDPVSLGCLG